MGQFTKATNLFLLNILLFYWPFTLPYPVTLWFLACLSLKLLSTVKINKSRKKLLSIKTLKINRLKVFFSAPSLYPLRSSSIKNCIRNFQELMVSRIQGSYVAFPSRHLLWSKGLTLRRYVATVHMAGRTERCLSLKCNFCISVGTPRFSGVKVKPVKISAFKGSARNDESGGRASGSKIAKNSVKLSYIPKESEETVTESSKAHNVPLSYASETNETIAGSPAIHKLFKKWLTMLRTQTLSREADEILEEEQPLKEISETNIEIQNKGRGEILRTAWGQFWDLDATIKLPFLIFVPWFLAVNVIYGAEVSKELTPLWIFGPLIVALYVKMFRWLSALYVFSFKLTIKLIKNLPTYYAVALNYIKQGKLKEDVRARVWQPVVDIKNLDYKELSRRKLKEFQVWLMERYLDYVESIWPSYCRTIRFLKRANLI